jgi:hypothetical protein
MTRENKVGLAITGSFLCLVGVVVWMKSQEPAAGPPSNREQYVAVSSSTPPAAAGQSGKLEEGKGPEGKKSTEGPGEPSGEPRSPAPETSSFPPPPPGDSHLLAARPFGSTGGGPSGDRGPQPGPEKSTGKQPSSGSGPSFSPFSEEPKETSPAGPAVGQEPDPKGKMPPSGRTGAAVVLPPPPAGQLLPVSGQSGGRSPVEISSGPGLFPSSTPEKSSPAQPGLGGSGKTGTPGTETKTLGGPSPAPTAAMPLEQPAPLGGPPVGGAPPPPSPVTSSPGGGQPAHGFGAGTLNVPAEPKPAPATPASGGAPPPSPTPPFSSPSTGPASGASPSKPASSGGFEAMPAPPPLPARGGDPGLGSPLPAAPPSGSGATPPPPPAASSFSGTPSALPPSTAGQSGFAPAPAGATPTTPDRSTFMPDHGQSPTPSSLPGGNSGGTAAPHSLSGGASSPMPPAPAPLPAFTGAAPTLLPPAGRTGGVQPAISVDSWEEKSIQSQPGDTWESLSRAHFGGSPNYAEALKRYNIDRGPSGEQLKLSPTLPPGMTLSIPSAQILNEKYNATIQKSTPAPATSGGPSPGGFASPPPSMPSMTPVAPPPSPIGPPTPAPSGSSGTLPPPSSSPPPFSPPR